MHMHRGDESSNFLTREPPELHALACLVHGALTALHALGAVYNYRRRNWRDVAAHVAAALYDARSARHHYRTEQIALRRRSSAALHLVTPANLRDGVEVNPVDRRSATERRQAAQL
jgi:hypothetical protein